MQPSQATPFYLFWFGYVLEIEKSFVFVEKMKVKIYMHIEQCNVVVIIKYEIKSMKTLEDTIS